LAKVASTFPLVREANYTFCGTLAASKKTKRTMRLAIIVFLTIIIKVGFGQESFRTPVFIDIDKAMNDLIENNSDSKYYTTIDYQAIIYLDTSYYQIIQKIWNEDNIWPLYTYNSSENKAELDTIFTSILNIKELFQYKNKHILDEYFQSREINNYEMNEEVYIKKIERALIYISGHNWAAQYKLELKEEKVLIDQVMLIMEDSFE